MNKLMPQTEDVSPRVEANTPTTGHSVIERVLSIACSPDGQAIYAGSHSNLWVSTDCGQNWKQLSCRRPPPDPFDVPGSLGGGCVVDIAVALGWSVEKHPRFVADLTGKRRTDIVGFGDCGVWTALGNSDGSFQAPSMVLANFGCHGGGWQFDKHPRFVADLNGDGCADILGFGDAGVWTAIGNGDGTFQEANFVLANFGYQQQWRVDKHPRFVADLNGDGYADIIGFGDAGVWTAIGNGDGTFQEANFVLANFVYQQEWRVDKHPRFVADLNGDGCADIVGFGDAGVWTAIADGDDAFQQPKLVLANFGYQQEWRVDKHPRFLADLNGDGCADIVGFGDVGVWTAIGNGDGTFQKPTFVLTSLGYQQEWRVDKHPRFVADLNGDGCADIIGFGDAGVWTAIGNGDGTFQEANCAPADLDYQQGWRVNRHYRMVTDLNGDGNADLVGFGDAGVWTAINDGQGGFPGSDFVLANFGYRASVLALTVQDRIAGSKGI